MRGNAQPGGCPHFCDKKTTKCCDKMPTFSSAWQHGQTQIFVNFAKLVRVCLAIVEEHLSSAIKTEEVTMHLGLSH